MAAIKITVNGTGWNKPVATFYRDNSTKVCYTDSSCSTVLTNIGVPTHAEYVFAGCWSGTASTATQWIDANGNFLAAFNSANITTARTIYIRGTAKRFGAVVDYFGLASSALVPVSSGDNAGRGYALGHNGTGETPATETSGVWVNPSVTYEVCADTTLAVTLGAAFAGEVDAVSSAVAIANYATANLPTKSGYMITSVTVETALGQPPRVTVAATANEGFTCALTTSSGTVTKFRRTAAATPAIQTYALSIPLTARHRPQNLLSAISGGGELQALTLTATADATVAAELGMPCASDIAHGRIVVTATTAPYEGEAAPTAGTGFTKTEEPTTHGATAYKTYEVTVRKELTA